MNANAEYRDAVKRAKRMLAEITDALDDEAATANHSTSSVNWTNVGDAQHLCSDLKDIRDRDAWIG